MSYRISYSEEARNALRHLPGNYRQRLRREIEALATEPRPEHARPMRGEASGRYRIRLDRWRLIYRVLDEEGAIRILRIAQKAGPETYAGLEE